MFVWTSKNQTKVGRTATALDPLVEPRIINAIESGLEAAADAIDEIKAAPALPDLSERFYGVAEFTVAN